MNSTVFRLAAVGAVAVIAVVVGLQFGNLGLPQLGTDGPATTTRPAPTSSAEASPAGTPAATPSAPSATTEPDDAQLVVRLEMFGHITVAFKEPNLSVYADGLVVDVSMADGSWQERRLTAGGVDAVVAEVTGTGLFEEDRQIVPQRRPDAQPPGQGTGVDSVTVSVRDETITVSSVVLSPELAPYYEPSAERDRFAQLVERLQSLESWLPRTAWADADREPYRASEFLLMTGRIPDIPPAPDYAVADVADVDWPSGISIEEFGESPEINGEPATDARCGLISRETAEAILDALSRAGVETPTDVDQTRTFSTFFPLAWAAENGEFDITLRPLLPDQRSCEDALTNAAVVPGT